MHKDFDLTSLMSDVEKTLENLGLPKDNGLKRRMDELKKKVEENKAGGDEENPYTKVFEDLFKDLDIEVSKKVKVPALNSKKTDKEYVLEFDIPGLESKKEIDITLVSDRELSISGERKLDSFDSVETFKGKFSRKIAIPEDGDVRNINATYKNGVLKISIARIEEKSIKIEIK